MRAHGVRRASAVSSALRIGVTNSAFAHSSEAGNGNRAAGIFEPRQQLGFENGNEMRKSRCPPNVALHMHKDAAQTPALVL